MKNTEELNLINTFVKENNLELKFDSVFKIFRNDKLIFSFYKLDNGFGLYTYYLAHHKNPLNKSKYQVCKEERNLVTVLKLDLKRYKL